VRSAYYFDAFAPATETSADPGSRFHPRRPHLSGSRQRIQAEISAWSAITNGTDLTGANGRAVEIGLGAIVDDTAGRL
jgi:hypothetical protein